MRLSVKSPGATVVCEMSYASRVEHDRFPETFVVAEGERGSVELGPDYWLRVTTDAGTSSRRVAPPGREAQPAMNFSSCSIVSCCSSITALTRSPIEITPTIAPLESTTGR